MVFVEIVFFGFVVADLRAQMALTEKDIPVSEFSILQVYITQGL